MVVAAWISVLFAVVPLLMAWRNLHIFTRPRASPPPATRVSILLPARDESADIERAVRAALASGGVEVEVLVIDDESSDDTAAIVERIAAQDARVRLLRAAPLPPGWAGKQRACSLLAAAARFDVLMFVDVDVRLAPRAAADAAARLLADPSLGMVSGFPRELAISLGERLVIPWIHVLLLGYLPMARMRASVAPAYGAACGQWIVFAGSDRDPGKYYLLDRATRKLTLITEVRPQLNGIAIGEERPVSFPARDGTMIPGYLTLPPGKPAKNLPAIVMPHGGPAARDEWGFDWLPQFYASSGYAVLQPNYRGSTGYGEAWFRKNGFRSWETAIGDVNDGARWLAAQGIADPRRLAIVGWSYGGYAALQANVVDPTLYRAAVAIAPVTELAMLRDRSNGRSSAYVLVRDYIGSGPHLTQGSPARNAARIKVPVMLFHGDRDVNVDIAQSRLMLTELQKAGVPRKMVVYPGLDHQLDSSEARADMLARSAAFLGEALGAQP